MAAPVGTGSEVEEEDAMRPDAGRLVAALAVVGTASALVLLPVLVAFGGATGWGREVVAGLAGLVAVVGGVKLAAMAWGLAASVD